MQIKLCKLHNAKQIIRDKLRKYIKNHQLSQIIELKCRKRAFTHLFRQVINLPQNGISIPDASQYSHLEMQGISLGFVDGIFLQHTWSATAVTQAQNGTVETETGVAQVRITRLLQFEIVTGGIEVCHAVWQGRETQRCIAGSDNLQGILAIFIGQFDIRTVLMVAVVLRTGIVGKLILHATLVPSIGQDCLRSG